ncbi:MAG: hypothetical protein HY897_02355 [Deltaproteobacteria bacterium]|nr:hypothetical protein [Deltaproteobacteria bacterium]
MGTRFRCLVFAAMAPVLTANLMSCGDDVTGGGDSGAEGDVGRPETGDGGPGEVDGGLETGDGGQGDTGTVGDTSVPSDASHPSDVSDQTDGGPVTGDGAFDAGPDAGADAATDAGFDSSDQSDASDASYLSDVSADAGDAGVADGGPGDAADAGPEAEDAGPADAGACTPDPQTPADGVRTVLMAHPYGAAGSDCGRNVEVLRLDSQGVLTQSGTQIEVDDCPKRIVFSPDGRLVIIASYNDHVAPHPMSVKVYRHDAAGDLTFVGKIDGLDGTAPEDIAFSHDGKKAYVTDFDSQGGVHVLDVEPGCRISYVTKIPLWAPTSIAVLPGDDFAVAVGGQDPKDLAMLDLGTNTVAAHHDLFADFVDAPYVAVSPDGRGVLVPSGNPYSDVGNMLFALKIDYSGAIPVPSINSALTAVNSPEGVLYSPDGTKAIVTNVEDNKATWFNVAADGKPTTGGSITGMLLADRVAMLSRGPHAGTVLVGALSDIHVLKFTSTGVQKLQKLSFGGGYEAMTGDVAVEP